jgi:CRP/FNR family cyclic AMP-dependent transcriptional regulator
MQWQNYKPGEVIFREGEQSDAAYLVVSGKVRIVKGLDTAGSKEIAVVGAGEYVGEMGAIDQLPRSASALAEDAVVCAPVTPEAFLDMLHRNPEEAIDLLKILFERLREANKRLAQLEQAGAG